MPRPSLVDVIDTFEEYSDVIAAKSLICEIVALVGREDSGGGGGFDPEAGCRCSPPLGRH